MEPIDNAGIPQWRRLGWPGGRRGWSLGLIAAAVVAAAGLGLTVQGRAASVNVGCSAPGLVAQINAANQSPGADTLTLAKGCNYELTARDNTTFGPTGLPVITGKITILGNGSTILRSGATPFRLFMVETTGELELRDLTLVGGLAQGGIGGNGPDDDGGGGGGGAGSAERSTTAAPLRLRAAPLSRTPRAAATAAPAATVVSLTRVEAAGAVASAATVATLRRQLTTMVAAAVAASAATVAAFSPLAAAAPAAEAR